MLRPPSTVQIVRTYPVQVQLQTYRNKEKNTPKIRDFWDVASCRVVNSYRHFESTTILWDSQIWHRQIFIHKI